MEKSVEDLMRELSLAQEKVVQVPLNITIQYPLWLTLLQKIQQEVERKKQQSQADQLSLRQRSPVKDIIGKDNISFQYIIIKK